MRLFCGLTTERRVAGSAKEGGRGRKGGRGRAERRPWSGGKEAARGRVEEMEGKQRPFAVNVLLLHESVVSSQVLEMRIGAEDAG